MDNLPVTIIYQANFVVVSDNKNDFECCIYVTDIPEDLPGGQTAADNSDTDEPEEEDEQLDRYDDDEHDDEYAEHDEEYADDFEDEEEVTIYVKLEQLEMLFFSHLRLCSANAIYNFNPFTTKARFYVLNAMAFST